DPGMVVVAKLVESLDEVNRLQVLAATVFVRNPLPFTSRVIEVEHGRHGIDADAIQVVLVEPEKSVPQEEVLHLVPPVVEYESSPVAVLSLARVGMLVKVGAVEEAETVVVSRKVSRHPIEENTNAGLVAAVDEAGKVLGQAMTARGGEVAQRLVAPGSI